MVLNSLRVLHVNARSVLSSFDEFSDILLRGNCDVAGVTETWLSSVVPDTDVYVNGYNLVRLDRKSRGGEFAFT